MEGEAEHGGGSGFNIHPMDQFLVKPLSAAPRGHSRQHPHQRHALDGADRRRRRVPWWPAPSGRALIPLCAVAGRGDLRLRAQDGHDVAGKEAVKVLPLRADDFLFILFANVLALIPASFSVTSHATAILALAVFLTVTGIGFYKHGAQLPFGCRAPRPWRLGSCSPSSRSSPTSCGRSATRSDLRQPDGRPRGLEGVRVAGALGLFSIIPIAAIVGIYGLELLVAFIQAYVFAILTCVYLNHALHRAKSPRAGNQAIPNPNEETRDMGRQHRRHGEFSAGLA